VAEPLTSSFQRLTFPWSASLSSLAGLTSVCGCRGLPRVTQEEPQGFAAIVVLALGAVFSARASAAVVGAGSALAGAAAIPVIGFDRERRAEARRASGQRDLDETRRLAYMALALRRTERYELAATIVNVLAHHGSAVDPGIAMRHVTAIVVPSLGDTRQSEAWLRAQIDRITAELNPAVSAVSGSCRGLYQTGRHPAPAMAPLPDRGSHDCGDPCRAPL